MIGELTEGIAVTMDNTLFCPRMAANLISVHQLTKKKKKVVFTEGKAEILTLNNEKIAEAKFNGKFYELKIRMAKTVKTMFNAFDLWHRGLGHVFKKNMKNFIKFRPVDGVDYDAFAKAINDLKLFHGCSKGDLKKSAVRKQIQKKKQILLSPK